jgi:hypothetical protein
LVSGAALPFAAAFPAPAAEVIKQHYAAEPSEPCSSQTAECTVTWKADSDVCKETKANGKCTSLLQCQAETLVAAKEYCEKVSGAGGKSGVESCGPCHWVTSAKGDPVEKCKKLCDKINEDCIARCPKGDKGCMNDCNQENSKCLKDCEK